ncbi:MAG: DUF3859 domain-containing protein [Beijerinckiaceae bacterium]
MPFRKPLLLCGLAAAIAASLVPSTLGNLIGSTVFPAAFAQTVRLDRINIVEAGVYEAEIEKRVPEPNSPTGMRNVLGEVKLVARGPQVPAGLGVHFGVRYIIVGAPKGKNADIRIIWRYPSPGLKNPKTGEVIFRSDRTLSRAIGVPQFTDYSFDNDWEVVTGIWTLELAYGDRKLAEQSFTVTKP